MLIKRLAPHTRHADLLGLVFVAAASCAAVLAVPGLTAARIAVGVPFVLLVPGYALVCAAFADAMPELPLRLLLALALSLSLSIVAALGLNAAGVSLGADAFAIALAAVTVACAAVAVARRVRSAPHGLPSHVPRQEGTLRWALSILVLVVVFAGLLAGLREPLPNRHVAGYAQLWALRAGPSSVTVGVKSAQQHNTRYRVETRASGRPVASATVTLRPGQDWQALVRTGAPRIPTVEVRLYRSSNPNGVYRRVVLRP